MTIETFPVYEPATSRSVGRAVPNVSAVMVTFALPLLARRPPAGVAAVGRLRLSLLTVAVPAGVSATATLAL